MDLKPIRKRVKKEIEDQRGLMHMVSKEEKIWFAARIVELKDRVDESMERLNDALGRDAFCVALIHAEDLVRYLRSLDEIKFFLLSNDIDPSEVGLCQQKKKC